jgi:hypothetical protein
MVGPDLWETDRRLFETPQDRAAEALDRLKRACVRGGASSAPRGFGVALAFASSDTCSICLGGMSATAAAVGGGAAGGAAAAAGRPGGAGGAGPPRVEESGDGDDGCDGDGDGGGGGGGTVETPCGHRYHVRCIVAAVDVGGDSCPVCRRPMLEAFEKQAAAGTAGTAAGG